MLDEQKEPDEIDKPIESDVESEQKEAVPEKKVDENKLRFKTYKLDKSQIYPELMCPFGKISNMQRFNEERKTLTPANELERMATLTRAHFISMPMLATCCGNSACYKCLKDNFVFQIQSQDRSSQEDDTITLKCPFCAKVHIEKAPKLISDETLIGEIPWSELKEAAMEEDFEKSIKFAGFSADDQKLVKALIQAQKM